MVPLRVERSDLLFTSRCSPGQRLVIPVKHGDGRYVPPADLDPEQIEYASHILSIETGMHSEAIRRIGTDAQCRLLVTGSHDKTVRLWEVATGHCAWTEKTTGSVLSVSLSPDGKWAAAGTYDRKVLVWELEWGS